MHRLRWGGSVETNSRGGIMETDPFFKRIPAREMRAVMMVMMTATGLQLAYGPNSLAQQSLNDPSFQPGIGGLDHFGGLAAGLALGAFFTSSVGRRRA